jgi:hypothetical protein
MSTKRVASVLVVASLALMAQVSSRQAALAADADPATTTVTVAPPSASTGHGSVTSNVGTPPVVVPGTGSGSGSQATPGGSSGQTSGNTGPKSEAVVVNGTNGTCVTPPSGSPIVVAGPGCTLGPATPGAPPPPPPTPQDLLPGAIASATSQVPLPAPVFMMHNKTKNWALVQVPLDFRVTPGSWAPVVARAEVRGVWAEVTAKPRELSFESGDPKGPIPGTICRGNSAIEPYNPDVPGDCAFTYRNASSTAPGDHYHFITTFTTIWDVTWTSSTGAGGTLAPIIRTTTEPLAVAEMKALTTCTGPLPEQGGC